VQQEGGAASARVFVSFTHSFDAARYAPDASSSPWAATVDSLHRTYATTAAPAAALAVVPAPKPDKHEPVPFYKSPWFWGALGAAAFGAGAVYFATRDNSPDTIHLEVQVPK